MNLYKVRYISLADRLENYCYIVAKGFEEVECIAEQQIQSLAGIIIISIDLVAINRESKNYIFPRIYNNIN